MAFIVTEKAIVTEQLTPPSEQLWARRSMNDRGAGSADGGSVDAEILQGTDLTHNLTPHGTQFSTNSGVAGLFYGYDKVWFEHLHTIPASEDLGTILSNVQSRFQFFNAFREATKVLTAVTISGTGTDGTTITRERTSTVLPTGLPVTLNALQGEGFSFNVLATGDATIDMDFGFTMQDGTLAPGFKVIGSRAVVFPFIPTKPVKEQIEFLTDIIESRDGTEKRTSARPEARQEFGMKYLIDQQDPEQYAAAQALIVGMSGAPLGVGMWHQTRKVGADVAIGATTVTVDTTNLDFRVGSYAILWSDWNDTEIVSIDSLDATSITLVSPTEKAFTAGEAYIVPMQLCVATDKPKMARYQNNVAEFEINWESSETTAVLADHTDLYSTTYNGSPVLTDYHLMTGDTMPETWEADFADFDTKTGARSYTNRRAAPIARTQRSWEGETMDYAMALRKFFYWARGKQKSFWFPTNRHDLIIAEDIGQGDASIVVKDTGYATRIGANAPYNFLRITVADGTVYYREVTSAATDAGKDTLQLDSPLGVDYLASDVRQICFLFRARFGADKSIIEHSGQGRVAASMPIMGIKQ